MPSPAPFPSVISTQGRSLVDANGFVLPVMKGLDVAISLAGFTAGDYAAMAAEGCQIIRMVINWDQLQPTGPPSSGTDFSGISAAYVANIDFAVQQCAALGIYTYFNFYFGPQGGHLPAWVNTAPLFVTPASCMTNYLNYGQAATKYLAQRYGDPADPLGAGQYTKAVIGFGLNEITPDSPGQTNNTWLTNLYTQQATGNPGGAGGMIQWFRTYAPTWIAVISSGFGAGPAFANAPGSGHSTNPSDPTFQTFTTPPANSFQNIPGVPGGNYAVNIHDYFMVASPGYSIDGRDKFGNSNDAPPTGIIKTHNNSYLSYPPPGFSTTIAAASSGANVQTLTTLNVASTTGFPASGTLSVQCSGGVAVVSYGGGGGGGTAFTTCSWVSGATGTVTSTAPNNQVFGALVSRSACQTGIAAYLAPMVAYCAPTWANVPLFVDEFGWRNWQSSPSYTWAGVPAWIADHLAAWKNAGAAVIAQWEYNTNPFSTGLATRPVGTTVANTSNGANVQTLTTLNVASTSVFPASGTFNVQCTGGVAVIAYAANSSGQFTGCSWVSGATGTVTSASPNNIVTPYGTDLNGWLTITNLFFAATLRPVTLINDFAGGTAGQTVTPANSGGASGQAFDTGVVTAGQGTLAYDVTQVPPGQQQACLVATAGSGQAYAGWTASLTSANSGAALGQVWFRAYLYVPAAPAVNTTVFAALQAGGGICGAVKLTTAGTVTFGDANGTVQVTTAAFPLNSWFRLEGFIAGDPAAGQLNLVLYNSADSTTASSAPATATGLNTTGTMTGWRFGQATTLAGAGPYWLGSVGVSNAGYLGPTPLGFTAVRDDDGGCATQVAVSAPSGAAGTAGLVGSTSPLGCYPNDNGTRVGAASAFDAIVGRPMAAKAQKLYWNPSSFPSGITDGNGASVVALAQQGCRFWLCFQPAIDGSDLAAMQTALQFWINNWPASGGDPHTKVGVILYQEIQNQGFSPAQYLQCCNNYVPMIHGLGLQVCYDSAGSKPNGWLTYYPGDNNCDHIGVDFYGATWVGQQNNNGGDPLQPLHNLADNAGTPAGSAPKPFGVFEMGSAVQVGQGTITKANFLAYLAYIQNLMTGRLAAGKVNSDCMWYIGDRNGPALNTIGGPTTTVASGSSGGLISQIGNSTWTSTTAGALLPGVLAVASTANFGLGQSAGNLYVQCSDGTVAEINYTGISGNTFTGCTYWAASPTTTSTGTSTISTGNFLAVWQFDTGVTADFRVAPTDHMAQFYDALTAATGTPVLAVGGDVWGAGVSEDLGQHWAVANTGMYGHNWRRFATIQWSATENGALYGCVGLNGTFGGFLVSSNGGASWAMRSTQVQYSGNTSTYPAGVPADQARPTGNVLAQCGTVSGSPLMYTATYSGGVFRSRNNGNSWQNIGLSGGTHFGRSIAADPANPANVFASMFAEGVYNATNAVAGSPATWTLQNSSPNFAEQLAALPSGNVYVAGGSGAGGGLWTTPSSGAGSGTWSQVGGALTATGPLSSSSYWLSLDGYTDASGNDQLIIGCNNPVQAPSTIGTGYRSLMWVTVPPSGSPVFTDVTAVPSAIQVAYVPPDTGRSWWHTATGVPNPSQATGFREWLGAPGFFQPHVTIDKSTINTGNVSLYCAGATGVFTSQGNTVGAAGIAHTTGGSVPPSPPQWTVAINGMPAYVAHQVVLDPGSQLHLAWATRDWGATEISDGNGYNAATLTQWTPPRPGGIVIGGFAVAIDPATGIVFLSSGTKGGANTNGQIYARNNSFAQSNVSAGGTGGAPYATTTLNPGGNVAYGLYAGRDASSNPYLLALIQGATGAGGMWRFSGYSISAAGNVTGGTWGLQGSIPLSGGSPLGTAGGAANEPNGPQGPIVADPGNAGVLYCFDQNTGLWRNSNYGAGTWTQLWAVVCNDQRTGFIACNPAVNGELWLSYWTSNAVPGGLFQITGADTITAVTLTGGSPNTVQVSGVQMPGGICFNAAGDVYCLALGTATGSPNTQLLGSQNGGATWFNADNGSVAAYASYPSNMVMTPSGRIYIANDANVLAYGYPNIPASAAAAAMSVTMSLSATATDASSGTKQGVVALALTASLSPAPGGGGRTAFAPMAATAALTAAIGTSAFVVQVVQGTSAFDYGLSSVEMSTTEGNTLLVLAGWDLSTGPTTAPMPAVYVSDSAGNYWYHVTTTSPGVTGARCSAWICPNAMSIEWLSVSLTTFASSLAYQVLELSGMPSLYSLDCFDVTGAQSTASLMLNPGSTADDVFAFALFATGALTGAGPGTPGSWQALPSVTAGPQSAPGITPSGQGLVGGFIPASSGQVPQLPGDVNPVTIWPYFQIADEGASLATTFALTQAVPAAALVFAVRSTTYPPLQQNPNMPVIKVEAGFGSVPGDPSQAPPSWTDITDRVISPDGGTWVKTASGRQYELAQAEAGTLEIWVNNADGALTPGNANSVYAPGTGVVLGTPVHVSAFWAGRWYHVGYAWVERWPQEWPDLPQWGISKMIATDAIAVLAAVTMASALESDILIDAPYLLLPAAEQYLSFSNGTTGAGTVATAAGPFVLGSYHTADAQGLSAQNYSRSNQRPGMYVDGNAAGTSSGPAIAATGQTTNLLGSSNTGFGTNAITQAPTSPSAGPGILYTDPNVPDPAGGSGVTVSFWLVIPPNTVSTAIQPTVFSAYGPPSNYRTTPSLTVQVLNFTGNNLLLVTLADGSSLSVPFTAGTTAQQVTLVFTAVALNIYVNGALEAAKSLTAAQTTQWLAVSLGCPNYAYGTTGVTSGSFTCWDLAIYSYPLPPQRAVAQFATGLFGEQNVDATTRLAQLLAWAGIGLPRGGRQTFNGVTSGISEGPAYNLAGTTCSDQVNQIAVNEQGTVAAMPSGALTFLHRWSLFNQSPVAVFGDSPDPTQGQVPYVAGQSWGYDNTYLYNIASVTQNYGPNNLFTVTGADFTSQHEYFARSALQQTISTMSNLDAINLMSWLIAKYGQPSLRVSTVTIDAASNPQAAFPAILPLLQGQVATVTRTPVGGVQITQTCLTQRIAHSIGPNMWQSALQLSPYTLEAEILTLDEPGFHAAGFTALA